MHTTKLLPILLFALTAGGCVGDELSVPQSIPLDEPKPIPSDRAPEEPSDPGPEDPDDPEDPDASDCRDLVSAHPNAVVFDDASVVVRADVDLFEDIVVVTGDFNVLIDELVDLSGLADLRCIGGDLRIRAGSPFSLDDLPSLEYIGGAFIDDASEL